MQYTICDVFVFQAEDGIRDYKVTGVQTCALPISFCSTWIKNLVITSRHPQVKSFAPIFPHRPFRRTASTGIDTRTLARELRIGRAARRPNYCLRPRLVV